MFSFKSQIRNYRYLNNSKKNFSEDSVYAEIRKGITNLSQFPNMLWKP